MFYKSNAVFAFDDASVPRFFHYFCGNCSYNIVIIYAFLTACQLERMLDAIYKSIAVPSFCMNI